MDNEGLDLFAAPNPNIFSRMSMMVLAVAPTLPYMQLGLGFLAIAVVTAIGFYLVRRLRDHVLKEEPLTGSELKEFEEIHSQGDISPEEFRTIKTALAARMIGVSKDVKFERDESPPES